MSEIEGDYDSVDGIKKRAESLNNPMAKHLVERAEDRVYYDEDAGGYRIGNPDEDGSIEFLFHLGVLTGAALEREYPAGELNSEVDGDE